VAPAGGHRPRLGGIAEVVRHTAVEEVQEVHHNLVAGSSELLGIAEEALHMAVEEALEKHCSHPPQLDTAEAEDIVGTGFVEDTVLEVDRDFEGGIDLERGTGLSVGKKEPRMGVDLHMEAGRTFCSVASNI
jgi:hypothetical protein